MGGGGKTATTTQAVSIPPEVLARYNAVNARAEGLSNTPFRRYSNEASAFVAPITQTQQQGIEGIRGADAALPAYYNAATGYTAAGAKDANLGALDIARYQNPFTQMVAGTTYDALRQQQEQEMQGALGNAIRSDAFGGDRSGLVMANLARQNRLGMSQALAPIFERGYSQALQTAQQQQGAELSAEQQNLARRLQAGQQFAGLGTGLTGAKLQAGQALMGAGTAEQQTDQAGRQALYNQFMQEQGYPFQIAQFLANIAMGTGALSGSTTTTTQPAPFFSDSRLKHDIRRIGETDDGLPIYKFKYKGDERDQTHIGLMADDVEKHAPEAVGVAAGYKTVDYDAATEPRHHRAAGGSVAFDQDMIRQILQNQAGMYSTMYGQSGTPHGAAGTPGATGRVPAANLPVGRLATPSSPPSAPKSGLSELMGTANTAIGLGETAGKLYDKGSGLLSNKQEPSSKTGPLDLGSSRGWSKEMDESQMGRGYAAGGEVDEDAPQGLYAPPGVGLNIPDERNKNQLQVAGKPPDAPKSPFGEILDAAKLAAKVASFGMANGGTVDRETEPSILERIKRGAADLLPEPERVLPLKTVTGEKFDGYGDFLTSKQFVVPLLTGIGAMASSPSRYFGAAALQGLGAGAQAYSNLEKREQELAEGRAREALTISQIGGGERKLGTDGFPQRRVYIRGRPVFIDEAEFRRAQRAGKPYSLTPESAVTPPRAPYTGVGAEAGTGQRGPDAPEPVEPGVGLGTTSPAAPAKPASRAAGTATAAGSPEAIPPANPASYPPARGATLALTPELRKLADDNARMREESGTVGLSKAEYSPFETWSAGANLSRDQMRDRMTFAKALAEIPRDNSAVQSGRFSSEIATPVIQWARSTLSTLGVDQDTLNKIARPQDLANTEVVAKIRQIMASKIAAGGDQRSLGALEGALLSIPGQINTPAGAAKLVADMLVTGQDPLDREAYGTAYRRYIENKYGLNDQQSQWTGRGLAAQYDKDRREELEKEKKILDELYRTPITVDGKKQYMLPYLIQNSGKIPNEQIRKAFYDRYKKDAEKVLRYFNPNLMRVQ